MQRDPCMILGKYSYLDIIHICITYQDVVAHDRLLNLHSPETPSVLTCFTIPYNGFWSGIIGESIGKGNQARPPAVA
jgi:hypothetical protein